jgi:hypothetical protein
VNEQMDEQMDEQIELMRGRLVAAFTTLREDGVLARECFQCCGTCAWSGLEEELEAEPKWRGGAYWHEQDDDRLREHGRMFIGYGGRDGGDDAAIGREVAAALRAQGLLVIWDGDPSRRLEVRDVTLEVLRAPTGR